jgi:hypothetical protein
MWNPRRFFVVAGDGGIVLDTLCFCMKSWTGRWLDAHRKTFFDDYVSF